MEAQQQIPSQHAMGNVLQDITVLLVQQVQHKMLVVQEIIVQQEVVVLQFALQGHMEVLPL